MSLYRGLPERSFFVMMIRMMKEKIQGNTAGIRDSVLERMQELYNAEESAADFASAALLEQLAGFTHEIGREISIYLTRAGKVMDVSIGDAKTVSLPEMRLVRNIDRLCGVRCIHTHPNGSGCLSDVDLGTLNAQQLDAMCAVGVSEGRPTSVYVAYVGEKQDDLRLPLIFGPMRWDRLPQAMLRGQIVEADERLRGTAYTVTQAAPQRAILVGIENHEGYDTLEELGELAKTAGLQVVAAERQRKRSADNATYVGYGKAQELRLLGQAAEADLYIFDDELSAVQLRNLERELGNAVIDRTMLILDIFATRATTREGKLQVELAQLKYRLPRLLGMGAILSRQGASGMPGIGTRGPGEKKLEIDRRRIRRRLYELEQELAEVEKQRGVRREGRARRAVPLVALVGYTNAGKSTLLNALSGSDVLAEDMLFATLDPVVRQIALPAGGECLLSDTVGFINKLPHDLVKAFHSTLEEVREADVILHVLDSSCPHWDAQKRIVEDVLTQLGAIDTPRVELYNKIDLASVGDAPFTLPQSLTAVAISAKNGNGLPELLACLEEILNRSQQRVELVIPYDRYDAMQTLREIGTILSEQHEADGTHITAMLDGDKVWKLKNILMPEG